MNKVITINLNGLAYQLEESGYNALRAYLDHAGCRLGNNPDRDEIIADIERAIGDKLRAVLGANKTVVITQEVTAVIAEMGPVEDASDEPQPADPAGAGAEQPGPTPPPAGGPAGEPPPFRKLYRIQEGAMIAGVCNGLGAHFGVDPTFIRVGFAALTFFWGAGILVYLLLAFVVPLAGTPEEKAAATGAAATAREFIRRAQAGYYAGLKTLHDKPAHREWKRRYRQEMRSWKRNFQRAMRHGAHATGSHFSRWQPHGDAPPPSFFAATVVTPLLSLLILGLSLLYCYAVYAVIVHGGVFGLMLPAGTPLWVGLTALLVVFCAVSWPLWAARYHCHARSRWEHGSWGLGPLAGLLWCGLLALGVWWLNRHSPEFHAWLHALPGTLRHLAGEVRTWWHGQ